MKIKELAVELQGTILEELEVKATIPQAENIIKAVFAEIENQLVQGEKVNIFGFGDFETRTRNARKGRNPQTGEEIDIAETVVPAFKPATKLKKNIKEAN